MRWPPSTSASRSRGGTGSSAGPTHGSHIGLRAHLRRRSRRAPVRAHAARERREWLRHLLAWATGTSLLGLGVLVVGDLERTQALASMAALWTLILAIDFVISFSYTLWPRVPKPSSNGA